MARTTSASESVIASVECDPDRNRLQSSDVANVTDNCASYTVRSNGRLTVEVPYDPGLLNSDVSEEAVQLFKVEQVAAAQSVIRPVSAYLDTENKRTVATVGDAVVRYINGIVKSGESAMKAPNNFSPSLLETAKKADAIGLMPLVRRPEPGPNGDLTLDYPIDLRGLREDFRPSISIAYNSSAGYGSLGEGWNLTLPQISVETRWGVPGFDNGKETETYLFNGEQLVPAVEEEETDLVLSDQPHRSDGLEDRTQRSFVLKRSDGLWRFKRHKEGPDQFHWEASQKHPKTGAIRFYFFGNAPTRHHNYLPKDVIADDDLNQPFLDVGAETRKSQLADRPVIRWALKREIDNNGNIIDYDWVRDCKLGAISASPISNDCASPKAGNVSSNEIYLRRMVYYASSTIERLISDCQNKPNAPHCVTPENPDLRYETIFRWSELNATDYIRSDARNGGMVAGGRVLRQISTRMIRNAKGSVQKPSWACSQPFVTQTFGYTQESYGGPTGRKLLTTATTIADKEPLRGFETFKPEQCVEPLVKTAGDLKGHQPTRFEYGNETAWPSAELASSEKLPPAPGIAGSVKGLIGLTDDGPFSSNLLGSTSIGEIGGSFYGGIGFMGIQKTGSFGVKTGFQQRNDYREITSIVDLSGDGIPDRVLRYGPGSFQVQKGKLENGALTFLKAETPKGLPTDLQREPVQTTKQSAFEGHLPAGIYLASGKVSASAVQDAYLADIDGDRRVDVVFGGAIYYNRSTAKEISFVTAPQDSFFGAKIGDAPARSIDLPIESKDIAKDLMADDIPLMSSEHPRVQVVRRWTAQFAGDVYVDVTALPLKHAEPAKRADGVLVSVQRRKNTSPTAVDICDLAIVPAANPNKTPLSSGACSSVDPDAAKAIQKFLIEKFPKKRFVPLTVEKGDELFFAVHPNFNAEQDVVDWNPTVSYVNLLEDVWDAQGSPKATEIFGYKLSQPGEPGLDAVLSSLGYLALDDPRACGSLTVPDVGDPSIGKPISERELGLCDPHGNSYLRYSPGLDANGLADASGVFISPMRGTVDFSAKIEKPQTLFPITLRISVVHPSIYTTSTNPEEDLRKLCRGKVEPDRIATLGAAAGIYDLGLPDAADLPIFDGSLVCAQFQMAIDVDAARDPRTLNAWHEDLSKLRWEERLSIRYSSKYAEYAQTKDAPKIHLRPGEKAADPVSCDQSGEPVERCPDEAEIKDYITNKKKVDTPTEPVPAPGKLMLIRIDRTDKGAVETFPIAPEISMSFGRVVRNEANADPANANSAVRLHQRVQEIVLPESSEGCTLDATKLAEREYRLAIPFYTRGPISTPNSGIPVGNVVSAIVLRSKPVGGADQTVTRTLLPFARYRIQEPVPGQPGQFQVRPLYAGDGLYPRVSEQQINDLSSGGSLATGATLLQQVMATSDKAGTEVTTKFATIPGAFEPAGSDTVGLRFCAPPGGTIAIETAAAAPEDTTAKDAANLAAIARFEKLWTSEECVPGAVGGGGNACSITGGAILLGFKGANGQPSPGQKVSSSIYLPRHRAFDPHSPRGASRLSAGAEIGKKAIQLSDVPSLETLVRLPANLAAGIEGAQGAICTAIGSGAGCNGVGGKNSISDGKDGAADKQPELGTLPLVSLLVDSDISLNEVGGMTASCQTEKLVAGQEPTKAGPVCGNGPDRSIWIRDNLMSASRIGLKDLTNRRCEMVQNLIGGDPSLCDPGFLGTIAKAAPKNVAGLRALPRSSKTTTQTFSLGGMGAGGTFSKSNTDAATELIDLNGDGYPDQISGSKVLLTGPLGIYRNVPDNAWEHIGNIAADDLTVGRAGSRRSIGSTSQFNISFDSIKALAKVVASSVGLIGGNTSGTPARFGNTTLEPNFTFSPPGLSFGANTSLRSFEFADMNGDGLPDRISTEPSIGGKQDCELQRLPTNFTSLEVSGNCALTVELNHGYGLSAPRAWSSGPDAVPVEKSQNFGVGLQAGFGGTDNRLDFAGGIGAEIGASRGFQVLSDINGDGLPDLVSNNNGDLYARLNNGHGFTSAALHVGTIKTDLFGMGSSESDNGWTGAYVTFGFWIPFTPLSVILNPGVQQSNSLSRQTIALRDLNGDGLPDIANGGAIASGKIGFSNTEATVFYNGLGTRNLLRKVFQVTNPGDLANLEFRYGRAGLTNDDPSNHWVLSEIMERDGVAADDDVGVADNTRRTCISYGGGRFDRYERRFLGFETVTILEGCHDEAIDKIAWDRKTERRYANWSIYESGLLLQETVSGPKGPAARTTTNRYILIDLAASAYDSGNHAGKVACFSLPGQSYPATTFFDEIDGKALRFDRPVCQKLEVALSDSAQTRFDAAARSLQPFLTVTQKTARENQAEKNETVTALAYRPDFLGRQILACDYGKLDSISDDLCSNIEYADHVRVTVRSGVGGTAESETSALGLIAATTIEELKEPGGAGKGKAAMVRATTASYDDASGRLVKTCSFVNPGKVGYGYLPDSGGDENPCENEQTFPVSTDALLSSDPLGRSIAETYFRYDERGNLTDIISPMNASRDYAVKHRQYDRYLGQLVIKESTVFCRIEDQGTALQISRFAQGIETDALAARDQAKNPSAEMLSYFNAALYLSSKIQTFAAYVAGDCLPGSKAAPNIVIDGDNGPEMGAFVTNSFGIDYRLARTAVAIDTNRNMTMTDWDEFGRVTAVRSSWARLKDGVEDWSDYGFGDDARSLQVKVPDFGLLATFDYPTANTKRSTGLPTRLHQWVDPQVYSATNKVGIVDTIVTNFLFDHFGSPVQTIADSDGCRLIKLNRPTTLCEQRFAAIASGIVRKDRLGRDTTTAYPVGIEKRLAAADITIIKNDAGKTLKVAYDEFDRPTRVTNPDQNAFDFAYRVDSDNQHETYARNANCVPSRTVRDIRGNIISVTEFWHQKPNPKDLLAATKVGSSNMPAQLDLRSPWIADDGLKGDRQQVATCKLPLAEQIAALAKPKEENIVVAVTNYDYDALNQLVAIRQPTRCNSAASGKTLFCPSGGAPGSNVTTRVGYDAFGRRTWLDNSDSGFSFSALDLISNPVCTLSSGFQGTGAVDVAALTARCGNGKALSGIETTKRIVRSTFLFNLSTSIKYEPAAPDVLIQYGGPEDDASQNTRARIVKVKDGSGQQSFAYDELGQPRKTVEAYTLGGRKQELATLYERDAWGVLRTKELDGNFTPLSGGAMSPAKIAITYTYTPLGQIKSVETGPDHQTRATSAVLVGAGFDERGNNVYSVLGSGVTTIQHFDEASNRLTELRSTMGQSCAPLGSVCPDPGPPIDFQNVSYNYDPAGNIVHYENTVVESANRKPAAKPGKWGVMVSQSDANFAYDELNRLVESKTSSTQAYKSAYGADLVLDGDVSLMKTVKVPITEKFAYTSLHEMGQWRRTIEKTTASSQLVTHATYDYAKDAKQHRPAAINVQSGSDISRTPRYDDLGRLTIQRCESCARQEYDWNADDTIRVVRTALDVEDSKFEKDHLRSEMTYDRGGERRSRSSYRVFEGGGQSLQDRVWYADEYLSVYFPKMGQPAAMWHFFAGNYRLASRWDNQEGMFTYHPILGNQNITDVVFGDRSRGGHTRVYQQFGYAAYGEILNSRTASSSLKSSSTQPANDLSKAPAWRFNGKELDESTDLTYFGARYFDGRVALWLSPDPALSEYLDGKHTHGVYSPQNIASYGFGWGNPAGNMDMDGRTSNPAQEMASLQRQLLVLGWVENALGFTAGVGHALTFGVSSLAAKQFMDNRDIGILNDTIDNSRAFKAGEWASLAFGGGRLAYAGAAKVSAAVAIDGVAAVGLRNTIKQAFRLPFAASKYKLYSYEAMIRKYGTDEAVKLAAGRTSRLWNGLGAFGLFGGASGVLEPNSEPHKPDQIRE